MKTNLSYPSSDGTTMIHAEMWVPEGTVKAVLQISHGMVEFIDRYNRFGTYCSQQGILVCGNDHLGHGQSVIGKARLGYFGENGNEHIIEDLHTLYTKIHKMYPNVPYFLLGHSMGSFLARQYITRYGNDLSGAIIMGTGYQSPTTLKVARFLCEKIADQKGWMYRSPLLTKMALGSNNKHFEPARTPSDWLTKDTQIVDAYVHEPLDNFQFTTNAFDEMFKGLQDADAHINQIPKDLPILFASGADDPVGDFGKGVQKVYHMFVDAQIKNVECKLYENDRHEILNELNYKQVYNDLIAWMKEAA